MMKELFEIIKIVSYDEKRKPLLKSYFDKRKIKKIRKNIIKSIKDMPNLTYEAIVDFIEFCNFTLEYIGSNVLKDMPIHITSDSKTATIQHIDTKTGVGFKFDIMFGDKDSKINIKLIEEFNSLQLTQYKIIDHTDLATIAFRVIAFESINKFKEDMITVINHISNEFIKRV